MDSIITYLNTNYIPYLFDIVFQVISYMLKHLIVWFIPLLAIIWVFEKVDR